MRLQFYERKILAIVLVNYILTLLPNDRVGMRSELKLVMYHDDFMDINGATANIDPKLGKIIISFIKLVIITLLVPAMAHLISGRFYNSYNFQKLSGRTKQLRNFQ